MKHELELINNQIIFHSTDGKINLGVMLKGESIWLKFLIYFIEIHP